MNKANCTSLTRNVFIFGCYTTTVIIILSFLVSPFNLEKSTATSGIGFHLLNCPKLFELRGDGDESDMHKTYSDIRLSKESTEKFMTMLNDSLESARVLHAGSGQDNSARESRVQREINHALKENLGESAEIDINIPRRNDNRNLCSILVEILDEQIKTQNEAPLSDEGAPQVSISIMKLDQSAGQQKESVFLRASRLIRSSPNVQNTFQLANLDEGLSALVEKAKRLDFLNKVRGSKKTAVE